MNQLLCHIPNNVDGQTFLKVLKKSLRGTKHGVWARGRGVRKLTVETYHQHEDLRRSIPHKYSTSFAVYITEKPTFTYRQVTKTIIVPKTVFVEQTVKDVIKVPTKWA